MEHAVKNLIYLSECDEVGLGTSKIRKGRPISREIAISILELYKSIPQIRQYGFRHLEQIQLLVDNIAKDRICDISCSLIKSFLIDYTIDQCKRYKIPMSLIKASWYDSKKNNIRTERLELPINEESKQAILFVPKRWLRFIPWLNYDDYFEHYLIKNIEDEYDGINNRIEVLKFNRNNFDLIEQYISLKERECGKC